MSYVNRVAHPLPRRAAYAARRRAPKRGVAMPYANAPPIKPPITPAALADYIQAGADTGAKTNVILSVSSDGEGGERAVAAEEWAHTNLPLIPGFRLPEFGASYHTTGGVPHGENNNMCDDYGTNRETLSALLENKEFQALMAAAYGRDWRNADDRWAYRMKSRAVRDKDLQVHVDHPKWKRLPQRVPVSAAKWPAGTISVIALRQSAAHGIPSGGHSDSGRMIYSMFVSPLSPAAYALHCEKTMEAFEQQCAAAAAGRRNVYMWTKLCALSALGDKLEARHLFAAYMMYEMRPILYPSGKLVTVPHTMSAPYRQYTGYCPDETRQIYDPAAEIGGVPARFRRYFAEVHAVLPDEMLACAVSKLSFEYLERTLGPDDDEASEVSTYVSTFASESDVADLGDLDD